MTGPGQRPWWKKKRIALPAVVLLLLAAVFAIAVVRSNTSQIMIYNDTGAPLGPLTVTACGQEMIFPKIDDESSVRMRLQSSGEASGVTLSLPAGNGWQWEGSSIEPRGGYLVFIHLRKGLEVETNTQISIWQQLLFGRPAGG